jgi:hypothetical protein
VSFGDEETWNLPATLGLSRVASFRTYCTKGKVSTARIFIDNLGILISLDALKHLR